MQNRNPPGDAEKEDLGLALRADMNLRVIHLGAVFKAGLGDPCGVECTWRRARHTSVLFLLWH